MRIFTILFMVLLLAIGVSAQTKIDVESNIDFNLALQYAHATASVETLMLVTSGGVYTTADTTYFQIKKPLVIMAKPGLAEKPIFTHSDANGSEIELIRVHDDITFEGIVFDGGHAQTHGLKHGIRLGHGPDTQIPRVYAKEGLNIIVKDCDFRNFYEDKDAVNEAEGHAIYFLRPEAGEPTLKAGTVKFENCTFKDIGDEAIRMTETEKYAVERVVDSLIVRNCTFTNISSECIRFYADTDTSTADAYVMLEHLTMNNCASRVAYIKNNRYATFRDVLVTNGRAPKASRMDRGDYVVQLQELGSTVSHIDTVNLVFLVPEPVSGRISCTKGGEVDTTTIYNFDPLYIDADNMDYTVKEYKLYGDRVSDGTVLGDQRWFDETTSNVPVAEQTMPVEFALDQNYPNPFNPSTTISYSVREAGNVVLKIYDITGKVIATPVNTVQAPGVYKVTWQPAALSSGIYFYQLTQGNQSQVKKMMYIR